MVIRSNNGRATMCVTALIALMLFVPGVGRGQNSDLKFEKKIGVDWNSAEANGWMSFVAFNPDGKMVVSDGPGPRHDTRDGLTFWSFPEGKFIRRVAGRTDSISSDWRYYVANGAVVDLQTGKSLFSMPKGASWTLYAFSPDGHYVAESLFGEHGNAAGVHVFAVPDGTEVGTVGSHTAFSLAISPDDRILALGRWDIVTLWNLHTGKRLAVLRGFGRYVDSLSFSHDGRLLVAGKDYGGIEIWDVRRRKRLHAVPIDGGYPAPAFSPDGSRIAVGTYGMGTASLVNVATGKMIDHVQVSGMGCGSVAFSPDGRYLITPSTGGLIKWPYDYGGTIRVFKVGVKKGIQERSRAE